MRTLRVRSCIAAALFLFAAHATAQLNRRADAAQFRDLGDQVAAALAEGDLPRAEDLSRQRVTLAEASGAARMLGNAYRNLGSVLRMRGKYADAEVLLRKALPLVETGNGRDSTAAIGVLLNLGRLLVAQSRYQEAEAALRDALQRQLDAAPHDKGTIEAYNALANVERQLGRHAEAERLLRKAQAVPAVAAASRDGRREEHWLARQREKTDFQFARLYLMQDKNDAALAHARRAVAALDEIPGADYVDLVQNLTVIGTACLRLGRADEAEHALRRALDVGERKLGKAHRETSQAAMFLGLTLAQRGRAAEARPLLERAVAGARQADALEQVAIFERQLGRFLLTSGHPAEALDHYRGALDAVDHLFARTQGVDDATREGFISRFTAYYYEALELLIDLHRAQPRAGHDREALAVVSRTQSRLFTEMLRQADAGKLAQDAAFKTLQGRQQSLRARLVELRRERVLAGKDPLADAEEAPPPAGTDDPIVQARIEAQRARLAADIEAAAAELTSVDAALWEKYPRYMELTQPRPVTVDLLQSRLLKPGETLLSYFLLPRAVLVFLASREDFRMLTVDAAREDVAALVDSVRLPEENAVTSFDSLGRLDPEKLHRLYRLVFEPAQPYLKPGQRLLVVGDGPLHTLPLEMLVTRYGDAERQAFRAARAKPGADAFAQYAVLPYLGEHYRFAYLPSLSALASVRLYRKPPVRYERELVSFADPVFEQGRAADGRPPATLARNLRRGARLDIPRLPETADEARAIARILGGRSDLFLRERAQEHTAKQLDLRGTRYLHFATHGLLGDEFLQLQQALAGIEEAGAPAKMRNLAVAAPMAPLEDEPLPVAERGQPALLLSLDGELQGEDGLLTMAEVVAGMDLNAQLVVLSACNTAGEGTAARQGEGFAGLTRAFMYAGAQGILVSHWSVESRATQDLMTEMFRRLSEGADSLEALELARRHVRAGTAGEGADRMSRSHPYFWAPFVYVGD